MTASARCLIDALITAGVQLHAPGSRRLIATPGARVSDELRTLIRRFKPELVSALDRGRNPSGELLSACVGCDAEFVLTPARLCPWCNAADVTGERTYQCRDFTQRSSRSAPRTTVLTVPNKVETPRNDALRDSRTVRTLNQHL